MHTRSFFGSQIRKINKILEVKSHLLPEIIMHTNQLSQISTQKAKKKKKSLELALKVESIGCLVNQN